jgi:hypothetical protein
MLRPKHTIRATKGILYIVLRPVDLQLDGIYPEVGSPSIPPERLLLSNVRIAWHTGSQPGLARPLSIGVIRNLVQAPRADVCAEFASLGQF